MSKQVKELVSNDIKRRLQNVNDALLVNMIGMNSSSTYTLRKELRAKKINVLVVKNSMAARAAAGTSLAKMFDGVSWIGRDLLGRRGHRLAGQDDHRSPQGRQIPRVPAARRRHGRRTDLGRTDRRGRQVAQPHRAIEPVAGPDLLGRRAAERPVAGGRRGVGQPNCREGQRRRGSACGGCSGSGASEAAPGEAAAGDAAPAEEAPAS